MEQNSRQQNLKVNGVPENKAENLVKNVVQLGKTVPSTLKKEDVVSAMRVRKMDPQNTNPRAVIVKVRTSFISDEVLTLVMNFNANDKLNSHLLGYGGPKKPIFVTEHLSPLNKEIHAATRKAACDKGYKYVWVRDSAKQFRSLDAVALINLWTILIKFREEFNIYYQNFREMETKLLDIRLNIQTCNYNVIIGTETWLDGGIKDGEIWIQKYNIYRRDGASTTLVTKEGGLIAVLKSIDSACMSRW